MTTTRPGPPAHAHPVPLPGRRGDYRGADLWRYFRAGELRQPLVAGDDRDRPARQVPQALRGRTMAPADKSSDTRLTQLFLDMLAAEQGAGDNTLSAYRGDLEDLSAFLHRSKNNFNRADTEALRS